MKQLFLLSTLLASGCLFASGLLSKECSDGFVDPSEECDDRNLIDGDGCDSDCTITSCGNGILTGDEECDDLNNNPGDGCSPACLQEVVQSSTEEINGATINDARFAVFSTITIPIDISNPADGVLDLDLNLLEIFVSDREDMCDLLAANPAAFDLNSPDALADMQLMKITVLRRAPIGQSDFVAGETLTTNDGLVNSAFGSRTDSIFVGASIVIRAGGVNQVIADTPAFAINNGVISFINASDTLEANMSVTLTAEHVQGPFDVQNDPFDADPTPDIRTISSPASLSVRNISRCD